METEAGDLQVRLLGPIEVIAAGNLFSITQPGLRALLAILALSANRVVSESALIDGLWRDEVARPREGNLHAQVYQLRRRLAAMEPGRGSSRLVTRPPGYVLNLGPAESDLAVFTWLVARGRAALRTGDTDAAVSALGDALALWRGPALADVAEITESLSTEAAALDEHRLSVQTDYADAALAAGRHAELAVDLATLVAQHPLRERLRGQLMLALYRSGRQSEALACYREGWRALKAELGVEPGPDLKNLQDKVLHADASLAAPSPGIRAAAGPPIPRQLPAGVRHFAGRAPELKQLDALLSQEVPGGTVVITTISGTGGIGKTTLALRWGHQIAAQFPDGQLYVNLRGYDPSGVPLTPAEAIRGFLDALGVPPSQIPEPPDAQVALYRTILADRRVLIVLDNARDPEQVRPLLPASPGCLVVVTSRSAMTGLSITDGAVTIPLELVTHAEAEELLAARLGADRLTAEPAATAQLIALCARLPLALAITAARAAASPAVPLRSFAAQMNSEHDRLDAFDIGDSTTSVRAVFSWSVSQLSDEATRLFRMLGLHPGPDLTPAAASSMAGVPEHEAQRLLAELARASLISEHPGGRYALHDLLRAYAAEKAASHETTRDRQLALRRLLDHYLYTARPAGALIFAADLPLPELGPLTDPAVTPERAETTLGAISWFQAEHQVLVAAATRADAIGADTYAWQIPCTMTEYFRAVARTRDWANLDAVALRAATRLGDDAALGRVYFSLGTRSRITGAYDDAIGYLRQSMSHFRVIEDLASQASVHLALSSVYRSQRELRPERVRGDLPIALSHAGYALDWSYAAGDRTGEARAVADLANHYLALGELQTAMAYCVRALELSRQIGHMTGHVDSLDTLGRIHAELGDYQQAIKYFLDALAICSHAGIPVRPPHILESLGDTYLAAGDTAAARATWQELIEYARWQQRSEHPWLRQSRVLSKLERLTEQSADPELPAGAQAPPERSRWSPAPASQPAASGP
ncbi:MAG TPA: BTAD domain-containing putative transcriptional regulator [Streptosporangiaceae bacterium]|nr:BTAD domain-containing putative transcriptional regulator [Streptosporangiaceae bacterium]